MYLRILIIGGDPDSIRILETIACELGHHVEAAMDGDVALEKYRSNDPDLIFVQIAMPHIDGLEITRRIRAEPFSRWVPIIYHATQHDVGAVVRSLEVGGDDYLIEPTPPTLISAKISSYSRILGMQRAVRGRTQELREWRDTVEEQNVLGQHVVNHLLNADGLRDPMLKWMNTPAEYFSGDLVCAARGPGEILYVMLADATGHGLSATLTALPLAQIFYGMAGKGFSIETIAEELNRKLKALLPADRFVAAILAAVDTRNQTIEIWNGGNPEVLLLADDGNVVMRWPSRRMPLGILPDESFDGTTEIINYLQPGELVLFSDGIIEVEDPAGERLNCHGVEALLCAAPAGERLDALQAGLARHMAGRRQLDDLSSIVVRITTERRQEIRLPEHTAASQAIFSEWSLDLSWGAAELRNVDVVPAVLGFMSQINALKPHQGNLYLILSELFNNALDHGLLELDSGLKNGDDGFERYLEERESRLESLADGRVDMRFHLHRLLGSPMLDINLKDTGQGFDYGYIEQLSEGHADAPLQHHGRGIMLIKRLCRDVVYYGRGNVVAVRYAL